MFWWISALEDEKGNVRTREQLIGSNDNFCVVDRLVGGAATSRLGFEGTRIRTWKSVRPWLVAVDQSWTSGALVSSASTVPSQRRTIVGDVIRFKKNVPLSYHFYCMNNFLTKEPSASLKNPSTVRNPTKSLHPSVLQSPLVFTAAHTAPIAKSHHFPMRKIQQPKHNTSHGLSTTVNLTPIHKRQPTSTHPKPYQPTAVPAFHLVFLHYSPHPI